MTSKRRWVFGLILYALLIPHALIALLDLNTLSQDYIVETKHLEFVDYPLAFNPSITRWQDRILLTFRVRDPKTLATDRVAAVWLDNDMNPLGKPSIITGFPQGLSEHPWPQDPRPIVIGNDLYLVYSDTVNLCRGEVRRMFISKLMVDDKQFHLGPSECLLRCEEELKKLQEKNWVPFDYDGSLLLTYSITPHRILLPLFGKQQCRTIALTGESSMAWDWGEIRGGTTALKVGNEYLAFLHSLKGMKTVQSGGKQITHYFMAAYTFEKEPPFRITRIGKTPLMHPSFYDGKAYQTWKPLRVVFPASFILQDDYLWIAYGKQDHEIWLGKVHTESLLDSLTPVPCHD